MTPVMIESIRPGMSLLEARAAAGAIVKALMPELRDQGHTESAVPLAECEHAGHPLARHRVDLLQQGDWL